MIDPISLEILWTRLVSLVDEAAATLVRTSFSTIVRESNDYAVVLLDRDGRARLVLSLSDPGVPNWVDPAGLTQGLAQWRWYLTGAMPTPSQNSLAVMVWSRSAYLMIWRCSSAV